MSTNSSISPRCVTPPAVSISSPASNVLDTTFPAQVRFMIAPWLALIPRTAQPISSVCYASYSLDIIFSIQRACCNLRSAGEIYDCALAGNEQVLECQGKFACAKGQVTVRLENVVTSLIILLLVVVWRIYHDIDKAIAKL